MGNNTLHIFNPEHDIALASGLANFTAPHAGRQLRHDLGWLPALWAKEGDLILVDNAEHAAKGYARLRSSLTRICSSTRKTFSSTENDVSCSGNNVFCPGKQTFCTSATNPSTAIHHISPWGWDAALKSRLVRSGISQQLLPDDEQLNAIRQLSHRRTSAKLLAVIREKTQQPLLTGEAIECGTSDEVLQQLAERGKLVVKAPWSSSGRGVRFIEGQMNVSTKGWLRHVLADQHSVMVEPYYNKVKDFGMEFSSDGHGHISYLGLSLFHTANGAYTGNLLATECCKRKEMSHFLPLELLDEVQHHVCQQLGKPIGLHYEGPFGVDMMVVGNDPEGSFLLHPCVEINLRRTMGHVALALTTLVNPQSDDELVRVMRIVYEDNQYKLKIQRP